MKYKYLLEVGDIMNTAWDAVNRGSGVTLSNNNLTANIPNLNNTVRATHGRSIGKFYWEIICNNVTNVAIGVLTIDTGIEATVGKEGSVYYYVNGDKYIGTARSTYGVAIKTGDVISVLLDCDNGTIEFWHNGISQGVAASNLNKEFYYASATSGQSNAGCQLTANFGNQSFKYQMPEGYMIYGVYNKKIIRTSNGEILSAYISDSNFNVIPKMTSDTAPSGKAIYSAVQGYPNYGWAAFDKSKSIGWLGAPNRYKDQWIGYTFPSPKIIGKYIIYPRTDDLTYNPTAFRFEGSNDGVNWETLDKQVNITGWVGNVGKVFECNNTKEYTSYRIYIDATGAGNNRYCGLAELEMYETYNILISFGNKFLTGDDIRYFGLDEGVEISLADTFGTKQRHINSTYTTLDSGKVFTQKMNTKYPIKEMSIE